MSKTLFDIVDSILSSMDGDEVTSIEDTVESLQIAKIVRDSFEDMQATLELPNQMDFFQLTEVADTDFPVFMSKPTNVLSVDWVKYDNQVTGDTLVNYQKVFFVPFEEFMYKAHQLVNSDTNVTAIEYTGGLNFSVYNDRFPKYYTTTDDNTIIFDSFNSDEDTYLKAAKTLAYGLTQPTFTLSDSFVIPLNTRDTNLLLQTAKAQAFVDLKQVANPIAERRVRKGMLAHQRTKNEIKRENPLYNTPNYGRKV